MIRIEANDRDLFLNYNDTIRNSIIDKCLSYMDVIITVQNLTDFKKVWDILPDLTKKSYFLLYTNIFYDYKLNTTIDASVNSWVEKFVARLFFYLEEKQVFNNFNALAYDTEEDRYTTERTHDSSQTTDRDTARDMQQDDKQGSITKVSEDIRTFDYPQYTRDVITNTPENVLEFGTVIDNKTSITGLMIGVNIDERNSVSTRNTDETQTAETTSNNTVTNETTGELIVNDFTETFSIPKEVMAYASERFNQMMSLKPLNYTEYYNWMIPLFLTFYTQSGDYD